MWTIVKDTDFQALLQLASVQRLLCCNLLGDKNHGSKPRSNGELSALPLRATRLLFTVTR